MAPSVAETVAKLTAQMDENPWTLHAPTVEDIVETVRVVFGDDEARMVRITVH